MLGMHPSLHSTMCYYSCTLSVRPRSVCAPSWPTRNGEPMDDQNVNEGHPGGVHMSEIYDDNLPPLYSSQGFLPMGCVQAHGAAHG